MENNYPKARWIWADGSGAPHHEPTSAAQMERLLAHIQPIVKRNRVRARKRRVLKASGLICSISFFMWSANIFESRPAILQPAIEYAANLPVLPAQTKRKACVAAPEKAAHILAQSTVGKRVNDAATVIPENSIRVMVSGPADAISEPPVLASATADQTNENYAVSQVTSPEPIRVAGMEGVAASTGREWYADGAESNSVYAPDSDLNIQQATSAPGKLPD